MKRVILGTAGHIDHGKTQLVKALTGTDTDRLKEEKQRGISIELGFAHLDLGDDLRIGIVDVPGHEKFIRQMVAGSGGIDLAALVIALDEGVMPQTVEHLDILSLLNLKLGLVVLTKSDLVDEELALLAEEDVQEAVRNTFLENAPMVRVSSKTGDGIDELKGVIRELALKIEDKPVHGSLRLPVDRVFTLKGHGTVVTGTLISGSIAVGDEIEILPSQIKSSVRSIESHKLTEERALPGQRVAVNLRSVEQDQIHRGDVVTHTADFKPSYIVDVRLKALGRSPIPVQNRKKVRLHHYTSEVEARVVLPDLQVLEGGKEILAQLRTSAPIVPATGDRFVIRALSPNVTLGGGVIVNPRGLKLKARSAKIFLEMDNADETGIVASLVRSGGLPGVSRNELLGLSGLQSKRLDKILEHLKSNRRIIRYDAAENKLVHGDFFELIRKRILERLAAFHNDQPLREGISKQELRSTIPGSDKLFRSVLEHLVSKLEVEDLGDLIRLAGHQVKLKEDEKGLQDKIFSLIQKGKNQPPLLKEIIVAVGSDQKRIRSLLGILEKEGKIVRVKDEIYFSSEYVSEVKAKLIDYIKKHGGVTPSQFNEITASSRKYNIPLLEYFDREKFTLRVGDQRVLRGSAASGDGGKAV